MVVAGEVSGDIHAANLVRSLGAERPDLSFFGVGGDELASAGLECLARVEELAHMGLVEVLRELPRIRRLMQRLVAEAAARRPGVVVLVDSPDFNLRLAARLTALGLPVVLYVSPQLWAWRQGRVRVVRRVAREVLCILPFEADFYHRHGVAARYVGHPLVDDLARDGLLGAAHEVRPRQLALLPGSRAMEVRQLLPTMVAALATFTAEEVDDAVLLEAPGMGALIDQVLAVAPADARLRRVTGRERRPTLARSALAWTASGTATLECALLDVPMIVGYRLQPITHALAKLLVTIDQVSLVNLIAGGDAFPELIQGHWSAATLAATTRELRAGGLAEQRHQLAAVRAGLGAPGASTRAAAAVLEHLEGRAGEGA